MFSISHWLIIIIVVMIVFGANRFPRMMGDIGKGIKSLKEGLHGTEDKSETTEKQPEIIDQKTVRDDKDSV
jgi:sec-independent protein translocase protein TatA